MVVLPLFFHPSTYISFEVIRYCFIKYNRISVIENTVGGNEAKIRKYIQEQEVNDQMCDQLSFKEYEDPFKNVADFDDNDSPEVPADRMRK